MRNVRRARFLVCFTSVLLLASPAKADFCDAVWDTFEETIRNQFVERDVKAAFPALSDDCRKKAVEEGVRTISYECKAGQAAAAKPGKDGHLWQIMTDFSTGRGYGRLIERLGTSCAE